jgi:hypothetical protein
MPFAAACLAQPLRLRGCAAVWLGQVRTSQDVWGLHTAGKIGIMCRVDAIDNALRQPAYIKGPAACCCCMASTHAHAE